MGGRTKQKYDYTVTHIVTQHDSLRKNAKCVRVEWVDRCLYAMRRCDERISIVRVPRTRSVTYNTHTMVQFTGIPPALKHTLKEQLNALDIKCADSEHMQGVTHLVSGSLATSEKFLCAMVSGIPIIKPNITCTDLDSLMWTEDDADDNDKKIVRAVMYWRGVIRRTHRLPFSGWRVRLLCTKARIGSYQRVLVCGGAEIVDEKWTHCFKSKDYDGEDVKGVRTTDYIFSYLFSHTSKEK
ncbi:Nucleotide excision repair factor NEF2, RAD4/CUT5 component [Trachipleistophora hominis]|uniref:Nucleotide excision repair factor NEF2, RAD4/CUT5 component n=1 Tax=Trachipleistophora hominis TaxID=72359 RepID=L7JY41_TRAHO|nr:Nucleotide excision repair factor NEF2, RAD4/CUT5 component [Trachipleistophora hominis]